MISVNYINIFLKLFFRDIDEIQAITNLDLNLICKNSTNCFEGDEIIRSYSYSLLEVGNNASIDYPIYSMNVTLKRLNATLSNETYKSDRFLCPNLIKVCWFRVNLIKVCWLRVNLILEAILPYKLVSHFTSLYIMIILELLHYFQSEVIHSYALF